MSKQRVEGTEDVEGMENRETTATEDVPSSWGRQNSSPIEHNSTQESQGGVTSKSFPHPPI